ncbi:MAG: 3D-(3,5/4)-trihydroxycyclohexane-1,2-dione acylhydrolase (decyclizing) [Lautropia sp.]|nr:3D-(3,5/4)-trihydroxycyclohexane-1,2-dione acylhydrolase (decyclizing) [Lautropia sp.]
MSKPTIRLTMAQALARYLAAIRIEDDDGSLHPFVGGIWAIFGHGNVCGLGEAMAELRQPDPARSFRPEGLPVYRAHNEQGMAHAAIAYGKAHMRRRVMAATSSIGPGATNMVTAAALAYVNRLPLLLLPGDIFANRGSDPVLQQSEDFAAGDTSVNDCFRPVSRYFDRIMKPEQLLVALPRVFAVLTDPALCGPVTLALPQDVQAEAYDYPVDFFEPRPLRIRRPAPDPLDLRDAALRLQRAARPLIICGGGVLYSGAGHALGAWAEKHGLPVAETQAGKSALSWQHPCNVGSIGVLGSPAANELAREADLVIAIGTRLQDFTSGSNALFPQAEVLAVNVSPLDATRCRAQMVLGDARTVLDDWRKQPALLPAIEAAWAERTRALAASWLSRVSELTTKPTPAGQRPYDAEVIGAVRDSAADSPARDVVVCAAGTLPAELHKLWRCEGAGNYHMDYGYSCMGYEIAGALGVKLARPAQDVIVMVGDGSYLMMNSEIATARMLGLNLIIVVLDNRGFGCISRLQVGSGSPGYNNLLADCVMPGGDDVPIDFAGHAAALGAHAVHVANADELKTAMQAARARMGVSVLVIDTTHERTTPDGGCWWDVGIPEVSNHEAVQKAHEHWLMAKRQQRH